MISFEAAIELIRSVAAPLKSETILLSEAIGRVLAAPVVAKIDSPRTDVSSMDGFAVRSVDLAKLPARLKVVGQSFAGGALNKVVAQGTCARIFTGAPVPEGADHIVIQEDVERDGELAIINVYEPATTFIRRRASDFRAGDELLPKGKRLDPRAMVAAAGGDARSIEVYRRPRLRVVSTGDELVEPGFARETADAIPESISLGVTALAEQHGATCIDRIRLHDDLASMKAAAEAACKDTDLIVVTGGASVGERDFAKDMFKPLGLELIFSRVAMKPGKPVWFGKVGNQLVLGLPGNPTSALVTARILMVPLLSIMQGLEFGSALGWRHAPLASDLERCGDRETFHRAVLLDGAVEVLSFSDSGAQKALADATILVRQAAHSPALERGTLVEVIDF